MASGFPRWTRRRAAAWQNPHRGNPPLAAWPARAPVWRRPPPRASARADHWFFSRNSSVGSPHGGALILGPRQLALHAVEAERTGGRHGERQQQRKLPGPVTPALQAHVDEHAGRRREAATQPGKRNVHAHVVLGAAERGEIVVTEVPPKISTCLRGTEQH